jgi:hypothetical protein
MSRKLFSCGVKIGMITAPVLPFRLRQLAGCREGSNKTHIDCRRLALIGTLAEFHLHTQRRRPPILRLYPRIASQQELPVVGVLTSLARSRRAARKPDNPEPQSLGKVQAFRSCTTQYASLQLSGRKPGNLRWGHRGGRLGKLARPITVSLYRAVALTQRDHRPENTNSILDLSPRARQYIHPWRPTLLSHPGVRL